MRENLISIAVFHSNTYLAMIFAIGKRQIRLVFVPEF